MKRSDFTENGNTFSVEKDGSIFHNSRRIGYVEKISKGNYLFFKHEKESGIFRKTNSWSIPYCILRCVGKDGVVHYKTEKRTYKINYKDAMEHGKFLYFKQSNTERKIYVPLKHWRTR